MGSTQHSTFTNNVCVLLKAVPEGRVVTYGCLAAAAGYPRGARQVLWVLHSQSRRKDLPWHRVVTAHGRIATDFQAADLQRELLRGEGVEIGQDGSIELERYKWTW